MKQLSRQYVYRRNFDRDIEKLVKSCPDCAIVKKSPHKVPIHSWEEPAANFERVDIDYAGPYEDHHFLVLKFQNKHPPLNPPYDIEGKYSQPTDYPEFWPQIMQPYSKAKPL
ncbi:hypothetical protein PR048_005035 [Dryococelus australis]|uniref:Integrase zinc-binding domain-containing protein n=1 Tax=Dryococelus australis TaxID=614101 RepID=A0ABQ9I726_9NEOP|nr:hypothetical protein PR048_005035 [Dryococelus australis]